MRIAIVGAGGQVGAEVALMLACIPNVQLVPIVRTRSGSAFLRYHGVPVAHADVADPSLASLALAGAHVVANFALAGGTPSQARRQNDEIIRAAFEHSDQSATIVFFSTLAVHGEFDLAGRMQRSAYGDLKLSNERLVAALARKRRQPVYILRLGHVAGSYQGLTELCRDEIMSPPVVIPNSARLSNVTHTVTIADALLAIGSGRAGPPGRYDLVNVPQWTWRAVYEKEAAELGITLPLAVAGDGESQVPYTSAFQRRVFNAIAGRRMKEKLLKLLGMLPGPLNERVRSKYYVDRARGEISALANPPQVRNPATFWPELEIRPLAGLTNTKALFASNIFSTKKVDVARWPSDLNVHRLHKLS